MKLIDTNIQVQEYLSSIIDDKDLLEIYTMKITSELEHILSEIYFNDNGNFNRVVQIYLNRILCELQYKHAENIFGKLNDTFLNFATNYFKNIEDGINVFKTKYNNYNLDKIDIKRDKLIITSINKNGNYIFIAVHEDLSVSEPFEDYADALIRG